MDASRPQTPWEDDDLRVQIIDGQPSSGFDCGRDAQNAFLYGRAWRDAKAGVTVTHLLFVKGILAGYVTLLADRIGLGSDEKLRAVSWRVVPAVKVGQLAIDHRFAGNGLGRLLIGYAVALIKDFRRGVGCRVITLDAQPDLVRWYERQGFSSNGLEQQARLERARADGRNEQQLPVSMRFDLREARR
jgi:GNAT superfamily N-acetyltransferase